MGDHGMLRRTILRWGMKWGPALVALLAVALVFYGTWTPESTDPAQPSSPLADRIWTSFYVSLLAFTGDGYFLGIGSDIKLNWFVRIGAFLAIAFTFGWVATAISRLFGQASVLRFLRLSGYHTLVIGSTETARRAAQLLAQDHSTVWIAPEHLGESEKTENAWRVSLPIGAHLIDHHLPLRRARRILIDTGNAAGNLALLRGVVQACDGGALPELICQVEDDRLADEAHDLVIGTAAPVFFNEYRLVARDALRRHPLFALADRRGQHRVHLLLVGFSHLGRIMMEQAILNSRTGELGRPCVTILDRDAERVRGQIAALYPGLSLVADHGVVEGDALALFQGPMEQAALARLAELEDADPFTAIALCLPGEEANVEGALLIRRHRRRSGRLAAPMFLRAHVANGAHELLVDEDGRGEMAQVGNREFSDQVFSLRLSDETLLAEIAAHDQRDAIAKAAHAGYLSGDHRARIASSDWERLPETLRRANRRTADHASAKLWALGFSAEQDAPHHALSVHPATIGRLIAPILAPEPEGAARAALSRLSAIEHNRWKTDRAMDGWRHGAVRDNDLRLHPRFSDAPLPPEEIAKDDQQVVQILKICAEMSASAPPEENLRAELRVGLAGLPGFDDRKGAAALEALSQQLVPALLAQAEGEIIVLVSPLAPGGDLEATERLLIELSRKGVRPGQLRLVVPEPAPFSTVLSRHLDAIGADGASRDRLAGALVRSRGRLRALVSRIDPVPLWTRGVSADHLARPGGVAEFTAGRQRVNAYLARRSDVLAAICDPVPGMEPGGMGELLAFREDTQAIPVDVDCGPSLQRPLRRLGEAPGLIRIDASGR